MASQDVEGEFSQQSEVSGRVVASGSAGVLMEDDVEHPVELVFDAPVLADDREDAARGEVLREDEVAHEAGLVASSAGDPGDGDGAWNVETERNDDRLAGFGAVMGEERGGGGCLLYTSIINLASVRDLEARLGRPVDPLRFRANLYVEGWPAWIEQSVAAGAAVRLGGVRAEVLSTIVRCAATHVDPATGARDIDLTPALYNTYGHRDCGLYVRILEGAEIAEGDDAEIAL